MAQDVTTQLLRSIYAGSWRADLDELDIPLEQLTPILGSILQGGGVGLIWPRIRHRTDEYGAVGEMLEHTYQQYLNALQQIEKDIALVTSMLADADIEAVLVKGWSLSRLYAPPQVRRPGDIDLIVPTGRKDEAERIIAQAHLQGLKNCVDLYDDVTWRSAPSPDFRQHLVYRGCDGVLVATLDPTDSLRQTCLHFIKHLRIRVPNTTPYWLCDIGAQVETLGDIDWDRLLLGDHIAADQVLLALALSRDIVSADIANQPKELADVHLPDWAIQAVTELWATPHQHLGQSAAQIGPLPALTRRLWPTPLIATIRCDVPLYRGRPTLYQIRVSARLIGLYSARVISFGRYGR